MTARLGIDVGGTFTDIVVIDDEGNRLVEKVPSTPHDASIGILDGIRRIGQTRGVDVAEIGIFAHGSTVATNALLEAKLPPTALIVTEGFGDVLEIGTQLRPALFDLTAEKPPAHVPRDLVFEVAERVDRVGVVVRELTDEAIARVVEQVRDAGVEAVAVSLLFSFRNSEHERRIAAALREALPDLAVAVSSDVAPEIKEYPRSSTAAVSAALQPLVARYMHGIIDGVGDVGLTAPLYIMQSNGGVMTAGEAARNAHRMVLSGPAAGVLAATKVAQEPGYGNQITFDMGGTSTDIALIHEGRAQIERETLFEGRPLLVPQFDIHTIGSGGGSLARVDSAGLLRVGPESAGAMPGPASYGRGGTRPTTTDAHVVLGRIDPSRFLGGEMALDVEAARRAVEEHVAVPLGITVEEAAVGILEVADSIMARGVRVVSVNRGFDPREFQLLPFGGAGPMHAANVARMVGVGGVLIPSNPGTLSAVGLADSDLKYDFTTVVDQDLSDVDASDIEAALAPLIAEAASRLAPSGVAAVRHLRIGRFRYAWQDNDVEVILGSEPIDDALLQEGIARFHRQHEFEFGHSDPDERVELAALSIESTGVLQTGASAAPAAEPHEHAAQPTTTRAVYFKDAGWVNTAVFERSNLAAGATFTGPAIIEEREATTVVPPAASGRVDHLRNLILTFDQEG
ncbi:hydantoinase/oxoprolinase family protein [Microbacterium sp. UCD-TDU]|uniref:hydantoinase/oxoprolinase family protein n=1 Tax=Microbacterium sp. UCD-TDU TaxID=1247714 RepID=UPI00034C953C|nr:hydantoinase/oxoprolinase family protein [Microbacterium sp. UCD-TDU]EYT57108.1 methylhydantoinase [Microbacterium sp. UCD-TDU]